jgi:hypothetical protein
MQLSCCSCAWLRCYCIWMRWLGAGGVCQMGLCRSYSRLYCCCFLQQGLHEVQARVVLIAACMLCLLLCIWLGRDTDVIWFHLAFLAGLRPMSSLLACLFA